MAKNVPNAPIIRKVKPTEKINIDDSGNINEIEQTLDEVAASLGDNPSEAVEIDDLKHESKDPNKHAKFDKFKKGSK